MPPFWIRIIRKFIWPLLEDILEAALRMLADWIKEWFSRSSHRRQEEASRKASEAERAADEAAHNTDRDHHQAVATVWREVAEMFRRENEELRSKVDTLCARAMTAAARGLSENQPVLDLQLGRRRLLIAGRKTKVPQPE
jgi:hypothetical protein